MKAARSRWHSWLALAVVVFLFVGLTVLLLLGPQDPNFRRDPAGFVAFVCAFAAFFTMLSRPARCVASVL